MLTITKRDNGVLRIFADGQLRTDDYMDFVPRFEQLADPSNPMLIELGSSFTGWTLAALWRDIKFDVEQRKRFGRIAVVGDRKWEKWGSDASNILFEADIRFFDRERRDDAEAWLLSMKREGS